MNIIDQLEQTVTPAILGASDSVAHISLLEQFYAILVTRLAVPEVYTQLQRTESLVEPVASSVLLEQLWQQSSQRHLLIQELAAANHIDEVTTEQLLVNAAHLAYQELKNIANGQFLPAFLQTQQPAIRQYLPVWASAVVSPVVAVVIQDAAVLADTVTSDTVVSDALIYRNSQEPSRAVAAEQAFNAADVPIIIEANDGPASHASDAIHANPSAHHTLETRAGIRSRNQRNDLLVRLLLLGGALLAIGLVWALFFKDNVVEPVQPEVVAPVVTMPETVTSPQVLTPVQLMVSVDDSGNLYFCSATVGDVNLQASLRQALTTSFSERVSICEITVQEGVATTLTNMNIETLPNILTLMRAAPFSRLQLQNDSISLEAPDDILLQRLLVDIRTLVPTMTVTSVAPIAIAQPPANTYDETYNNSDYNNGNDNNGDYNNDGSNDSAMQNNGSAPITNNNNVITNQPSAGINNNNSIPAPPPQQNNNNNAPQNNQFDQPSGPISLADVDNDLTNPIIAEPARVRNPAN